MVPRGMRLHGREINRDDAALYFEEQIRWFERHKNADLLTFDTRTGGPVEAVYSRINGQPRQYPAVYPWPPAWLEELLCA